MSGTSVDRTRFALCGGTITPVWDEIRGLEDTPADYVQAHKDSSSSLIRPTMHE